VKALRRNSSGPFTIEQAVGLDELEPAGPGLRHMMISMERATSSMPTIVAGVELAAAVSMGKKIARTAICQEVPEGVFRVVDEDGHLIALYGPPRESDDELVVARAVRVLRPHGQDGEDEAS
jgi:tRNA U55 pseudouridine synthase TruB